MIVIAGIRRASDNVDAPAPSATPNRGNCHLTAINNTMLDAMEAKITLINHLIFGFIPITRPTPTIDCCVSTILGGRRLHLGAHNRAIFFIILTSNERFLNLWLMAV
ncbi:MAG TPA: hypothetical protein VJ302_21445 [Blastocatellia bacterium]|nr:hypothetical protein [Blastocatellia bacterium]